MKRFAAWSVRTLTRSVGGFVGGTAVAGLAFLWGVMDDKRAREIAARADTDDRCCGRCTDLFGDNE